MRIEQIEIRKLFSRFNYTIPLHPEARITILHGANGFGKTTILRLIEQVIACDFEKLVNMPCDSLLMKFDGGDQLELTRSPVKVPSEKGADGDVVRLALRLRFNETTEVIDPLADRQLARLVRFVRGCDTGTEEELTTWTQTAIGYNFIDHLLPLRKELLHARAISESKDEGSKLGEKVKQFLSPLKVFVINTQRLITNRNEEIARDPDRRKKEERLPAVVTYAARLRDDVGAYLQRYGKIASALDRSLPRRLLASAIEVDATILRERYEKVVDRRQKLVAAGLLEASADIDVDFPAELDASQKRVLSMYVDDMEKKLSVFDGFAERVQLFTKLINQLFKYKKIEVGLEKGFQFRTDESEILSPETLSSGEQHQLVLLYDLLFRVPEKALILVDEPEISLHVEWQQKVLRNFEEISKLRDLDFVIATHAPDVIFDRWDVAVALGAEAKNE